MQSIAAAIAAEKFELAAELNKTLQMYYKNQKRLFEHQKQHVDVILHARAWFEKNIPHSHPQPPVVDEITERTPEMPAAYYLTFEAGKEYHHSALAAFNKLKKLSGDRRCVFPDGEAGQTSLPKNNPDILENGFDGYLVVAQVPGELIETIVILKDANVAKACELPEGLLD